jgi:Zn-dependent protease with chaperone function
MIRFEGYYFDGRHPTSVPATVDFSDHEATLNAGPFSECCPTLHLKVSPRIGSSDRFLTFPNNGQFACADDGFLDSLPQESWSEGPVAWLERRWGVALACVVITLCSLLVGYFFGLPAAAERIAACIPIETEQYLGRKALAWFDGNGWFKPTTIDAQRQKAIADGFERLCSDLPLKRYYHLDFRSSAVLGPNAIALPGGIIIITDDMVRTAGLSGEVLAVLAHEVGHVELHHAMRSVLQNSVIGIAVAAVTSDAASLSVAVAGLPVLLAKTKYSRQFEAAADDYAFRLLKQKGYSPKNFAAVMEKFTANDRKLKGAFSYVSSHPVTAERIQRARDAAVGWAPDTQQPPIEGKWLGESYQPAAQMWMKHLLTRKPDGTFVVKFRGTVDGNTKEQLESGRWDYADGVIEELTMSIDGKPAPARDDLYDLYKVESLTADEMIYTHIKSGQTFIGNRVPDSYELP